MADPSSTWSPPGCIRGASGTTDDHRFLVDLRPAGLNGKVAQETLDHAGITGNKNSISFDTKSAVKGGGIRIGTPAVTTRGMKVADMASVGDLIYDSLLIQVVIDHLVKNDRSVVQDHMLFII